MRNFLSRWYFRRRGRSCHSATHKIDHTKSPQTMLAHEAHVCGLLLLLNWFRSVVCVPLMNTTMLSVIFATTGKMTCLLMVEIFEQSVYNMRKGHYCLSANAEREQVMVEKLLRIIEQNYKLNEMDIGEYASLKMSVMRFKVRCFEAEGLGHVSVMTASGMFGLMKMETLVINPFTCDMAMFSYDRIHAAGNESVYLELENTMLGDYKQVIVSEMKEIARPYMDSKEDTAPKTWAASMSLPVSIIVKGKKKDAARLDELEQRYLEKSLELMKNAPVCDVQAKKAAAKQYSDGLLEHGGPSTSQFIKYKGRDFTEKFFREAFFGV